jgi:2-methylcitrate dehydratase PrpD
MARPATLSERLAAWSSSLDWTAVPPAQRALIGLRALDTIGLILAGYETEAAKAVLALALDQGGKPECALFLTGARGPAAQAALAHGTIAHGRDFDDTFLDSVVHPGSTVIATALAIGEAVAAPDEAIAAAIAIGYEAAARLGAVAGRRFHARGFHATGVVGPLSAALTAARLYRLSAEATADALGLAASMSGGLMAFIDDGAWSKWLHVGWSAHGGILAAQLAQRGFRGPRGALDGRHNLFAAFLGEPECGGDTVCADLGRVWRGGEAHFKYYPCAHVIQPYLDAAIALRARHGLAPGAIARVTCAIAPWAVPIVCEPRPPKLSPATDMDAIASLPYLVAVALADGKVDLDALAPTMRTRTDLLALAARVEHRSDSSLGQGFDGAMTIERQDGEILTARVGSAPPDAGKLRSKFRANARRQADAATTRALEKAILDEPLPKFSRVAGILGTMPGVAAPA